MADQQRACDLAQQLHAAGLGGPRGSVQHLLARLREQGSGARQEAGGVPPDEQAQRQELEQLERRAERHDREGEVGRQRPLACARP
jgi:hypothetical protein